MRALPLLLGAVAPFADLPDVQASMNDLVSAGLVVIALLILLSGVMLGMWLHAVWESHAPHRAFRHQTWEHKDPVITEREGHRQP